MKRLLLAICLLAILLASSRTSFAQSISENSTELALDRKKDIPLKNLDELKIAVFCSDTLKYNAFIQQVKRYTLADSYHISNYDEQTKYYNTIIVVGTKEELQRQQLSYIQQPLNNKKTVILCQFGNDFSWPIAVNPDIILFKSLSSTIANQQNAAMSIFGGKAISFGKNKRKQTRIEYNADWKEYDISTLTKNIDAIADEAIKEKATPGMVVMAVKNGKVLFEKSYGYHSYDKKVKTTTNDIFDLASISKIVSTTSVIMNLYENGKIDLDKTVGHYLWQAQQSNKANTTIKSVLLHEGGFTPYIPFYKSLKKSDIQTKHSNTHGTQLADNSFLINGYYQDIMWPAMLNSPLKDQGKYVYSDISMYILKEIAEYETSTSMDKYVDQILFKPIGMSNAGYNPRSRFTRERIVPTEFDKEFRGTLLQGFVHDQGAAMAGGVAGHAGLFATANDLAIYGQMMLNRGEYGGVRFFKKKTIDLFTSNQSKVSRRGLGFDRYDPDKTKAYPSSLSNETVYGHTGYTGTCIWIDPKNDLIYIFLSNRVHPEVSTKLSELNIRGRIQDSIYETITK